MAVEASLPQIGVIIATAAVDSINPCAIGVLILLISSIVVRKSKKDLLKLGFIYIGAVYATYFIAGLGLILFLSSIPLWITQYISIGVGLLVVFAGVIEMKDFFWYGKGFSLAINPKHAKMIHDYSSKITTPGLVFLGAFAAGVELPCTGGPYLAITLMLSQNFNFTALLLLVLYNIIFVMPLVIILLLAFAGVKLPALKKWKQNNRDYMRLATGVLLVGLGWLLMLIANGTINFA